METNFFKIFQQIAPNCRYRLAIDKNDDGIVITFLPMEIRKGKEEPLIAELPPLVFPRSSADNLDAVFFTDLTRTTEALKSYLSSADKMAQFLNKEKEEVEKKLKAKQEKTAEKTTAATSSTVVKKAPAKYTTAMQKANELAAAGNPRRAISALPDPKEFPDYATEIASKLTELKKTAGLTLWEDEGEEANGNGTPQTTPAVAVAAPAPDQAVIPSVDATTTVQTQIAQVHPSKLDEEIEEEEEEEEEDEDDGDSDPSYSIEEGDTTFDDDDDDDDDDDEDDAE